VGLLLLAGGNAFVVWSEQYVVRHRQHLRCHGRDRDRAVRRDHSGRFERAELAVIAGLLLGFLGTLLLVGPRPPKFSRRISAALALTMRAPRGRSARVRETSSHAASPYMGAAFQMIVGGARSPSSHSARRVGIMASELARIGAIAYLVVFGIDHRLQRLSYALRHASPRSSAPMPYVNPVIAVLLGCCCCTNR